MLGALAFVFVSSVDPLFLHGGNQLSERNFIFNERISKAAYYAAQTSHIDCIILGSSRMTFLDGRAIGGCANFAFSGAVPAEILIYAQYLHRMGVRPKRVIIGVDRFGELPPPEDLPDFIVKGQPVGTTTDYYLSLDLLVFSIKALAGFSHSPNFYDGQLRKHVGNKMRAPGRKHDDVFYVTQRDLDLPDFPALASYRELRRVFPHATYIAVVPPISRWAWQTMEDPRIRNRYIEGMLTYAQLFDEFYDLSFLQNPCYDTQFTYDGVHYAAELWDRLAPQLVHADPSLAVATNGNRLGRAELERRYENWLELARARSPDAHCPADR